MSGVLDRRAVAVRIAGQEYKIRSDGDEEGLVRIAGYVDQAMARVREKTGTVDSLDVAVLTCLNLAREILALHGQRSGSIQEDQLRRLIERVESAIGIQEGRDAPDQVEGHKTGGHAVVESPQRTLDLPSVEALRDRILPGAPPAGVEGQEHPPQVRMAAGGRDRVG